MLYSCVIVKGSSTLAVQKKDLASYLSFAGFTTFINNVSSRFVHENNCLKEENSAKYKEFVIYIHDAQSSTIQQTTSANTTNNEKDVNDIITSAKYDMCYYYTRNSSIDEIIAILHRLLPFSSTCCGNDNDQGHKLLSAEDRQPAYENVIGNVHEYKRNDVNCFVSTRGESERTSFLHAVKQGLATDKGLYMLCNIPHIAPSQMEYICTAPELSYLNVAQIVLEYLVDSSLSPSNLLPLIKEAYAPERWSGLHNICPVTPLLPEMNNPVETQTNVSTAEESEGERDSESMRFDSKSTFAAGTNGITNNNNNIINSDTITDTTFTNLVKQKHVSSNSAWMCNVWLMELFHGPTAAFKDFALQLFPRYFHLAVSSNCEEESVQEKMPQTITMNVTEHQHNQEPYEYVILTATSGDTGVAAISGFLNAALSSRNVNRKCNDHVIKGAKNETHEKVFSEPAAIKVMVLYPLHGVSPAQQLQMVSLDNGYNVRAYGIEANFDFCQHTVKTIFADSALCHSLSTELDSPVKLSSANSINWGRLIPQVVYYFWAYRSFVQQHVLHENINNTNTNNNNSNNNNHNNTNDSCEWEYSDVIDVVVPCGNFGNILAAYMAKIMGLPLRKLIVASNENDVLYEFVNTGVYDIQHRSLAQTASPSIDILKASNVERFLFLLSHGNASLVQSMMNDLETDKRFTITPEMLREMRETFCAARCSEEECAQTIKAVYEASDRQRLLDPHTAVAVFVAEQYKQGKILHNGKIHNNNNNTVSSKCPLLVASTAHWSKFPEPVLNAITSRPMHEPIKNKEETELQSCNESSSLIQTALHLSKLYDKIETISKEHHNGSNNNSSKIHRHPALNEVLSRLTEQHHHHHTHLTNNTSNSTTITTDNNNKIATVASRDRNQADDARNTQSDNNDDNNNKSNVAAKKIVPRIVDPILETIISKLVDFARASKKTEMKHEVKLSQRQEKLML